MTNRKELTHVLSIGTKVDDLSAISNFLGISLDFADFGGNNG